MAQFRSGVRGATCKKSSVKGLGHGSFCSPEEVIVDSDTRSKEDLLSVEFTMHPGDIENLVNLPSDWFSKKTSDVVSLTLKSDPRRKTNAPAGGSVIQFSRRDSALSGYFLMLGRGENAASSSDDFTHIAHPKAMCICPCSSVVRSVEAVAFRAK